MKTYTVKKSAAPVILNAGWESEQWKNAETVDVCNGFDCNSDHIPLVQVKMLHDGDRICGLFRVEDRYVVAKAQKTRIWSASTAVLNFSCRILLLPTTTILR